MKIRILLILAIINIECIGFQKCNRLTFDAGVTGQVFLYDKNSNKGNMSVLRNVVTTGDQEGYGLNLSFSIINQNGNGLMISSVLKTIKYLRIGQNGRDRTTNRMGTDHHLSLVKRVSHVQWLDKVGVGYSIYSMGMKNSGTMRISMNSSTYQHIQTDLQFSGVHLLFLKTLMNRIDTELKLTYIRPEAIHSRPLGSFRVISALSLRYRLWIRN